MGLQYGLEVAAVQNRGKAGGFGQSSCALLLLKCLFLGESRLNRAACTSYLDGPELQGTGLVFLRGQGDKGVDHM